MLNTLKVQNFALIDKLEINFSSGLNIITGETGAGKSIIVDALMILLGERASQDYVRFGEKKAIVEANFVLSHSHPVINILKDDNYFDDDNENYPEIIIRREINEKGNSRSFINDSPAQFSQLKKIGELLVDFHGQHDHQLLLNNEHHIRILDIIANLADLKNEYFESFSKLKELAQSYSNLKLKEKSIKDKAELQKFELDEINRINPLANEEEDLENELKLIENSELLFNLTNDLYSILFDNNNSVQDNLANSLKIINHLSKIDSQFELWEQELNSTLISINEISNFTKKYNSDIEFSGDRLDSIRERLIQLKGLRKKYGSFDEIFSRKQELINELSLINNFDEELSKLKKQIIQQKIIVSNLANTLSLKRQQSAILLENEIIDTLKELGIEYSIFKVVFNNQEINKIPEIQDLVLEINNKYYLANNDGIDKLEFYITTNKGEAPKPLANIASGGEISRVMLAIKAHVAKSDDLPILIFDEIDSGISGKVARKVGLTMKKLSNQHQVIAITHLAQIASLGNQNINVKKYESQGRTFIKANILDYNEKLKEIASMISGENLSEASLNSAEELINQL